MPINHTMSFKINLVIPLLIDKIDTSFDPYVNRSEFNNDRRTCTYIPQVRKGTIVLENSVRLTKKKRVKIYLRYIAINYFSRKLMIV